MTTCRKHKNLCGANHERLVLTPGVKLAPVVILCIALAFYLAASILASYGSIYV